MTILLSPPIAFLAYVGLVLILVGIGSRMAGPATSTALKTSIYASGEKPPARIALPGYRPFMVIALFFAVVHLGVLMLGSGPLTPLTGVYVLGLLLALLALVLG